MTSRYDIVSADIHRDRAEILSIWRGNLGDAATMPAKYDWFYRGCPDGEPLLLKLVHAQSGKAVGTLAAGPRRMLWEGTPVMAGLLVDLTVDEAHRTLGPALQLQRTMRPSAIRTMPLLYLFPNAMSAPVYQRAGYRRIGSIVRYARLLRHGPYLARHLPRPLAALAGACLDMADRLRSASRHSNARTAWSNHVTDDMDRLWHRSNHGNRLLTVRDGSYLRWRFDDCPLADTRFLLVHDAQGELQAWFACRGGVGEPLTVQDFWSAEAVDGIPTDLVTALVAAARKAGHCAIWFEFAGPEALMSGWKAAGFVARTARPVFGILPSKGGSDADMTPHLHLTSADEDQ